MKSIKPGRGPSAMGAIGSAAAAVFGIFWTIGAASMGAPPIFPLFGVVFIAMGVIQTIYQLKNATGKNRFSAFDITDEGEESDPLQDWVGRREDGVSSRPESGETADGYCPYCGAAVDGEYAYCPKCGKKLPS